MDFLTNNITLPVLDFFYGFFQSYGLAIVVFSLMVRLAVAPLTAKQILNMRKLQLADSLAAAKTEEIEQKAQGSLIRKEVEFDKVAQELKSKALNGKYQDDPRSQKQELDQLGKNLLFDFLVGFSSYLVMVVVFVALFLAFRSSPFVDTTYTVNLEILPKVVEFKPFTSKPKNVYVDDGVHYPITAILPTGTKIAVGDTIDPTFQTPEGKPLSKLLAEYPETEIKPQWTVTKGQEKVEVNPDGTITTNQIGYATIQGLIPGIAANKFLGRVGLKDKTGNLNLHIIGLVFVLAIVAFINQRISEFGSKTSEIKIIVGLISIILFSLIFLFFFPAGVMIYLLIINVGDAIQGLILTTKNKQINID